MSVDCKLDDYEAVESLAKKIQNFTVLNPVRLRSKIFVAYDVMLILLSKRASQLRTECLISTEFK